MINKKLIYSESLSNNNNNIISIIDYEILIDENNYFSFENIRKRKFEKELLLKREKERKEKIIIENDKKIKNEEIERQRKEKIEQDMKLKVKNQLIAIEEEMRLKMIEIENEKLKEQQFKEKEKQERKQERKQLKKQLKRQKVQQELDEIKQLEIDYENEKILYEQELLERIEFEEKLKSENEITIEKIDSKIIDLSNWLDKFKLILTNKYKRQRIIQQKDKEENNQFNSTSKDDMYLMPWQYKENIYNHNDLSTKPVHIPSLVVNPNQLYHDQKVWVIKEKNDGKEKEEEKDTDKELKEKELLLREQMLKRFLSSKNK